MDIVANAYILFIAGFETVATTISFCLFELAARKDIQDKVRDEIMEVKAKNNGKIDSECVNELHYMGMVIKGNIIKRRSDLESNIRFIFLSIDTNFKFVSIIYLT